MNIEEKKKELRCYKYYKEELERLYVRLGYIRDKAYNKSEPGAIKYSNMPKAEGTSDWTDEIAKMLDSEKNIQRRILTISNKITDLDDAIENLEDIDEKRILKLYYINCLSIRNIAPKVCLSKSTVFDTYTKGVKNLNIKFAKNV